MSINKVRSMLYRLARLLGDVSAIEKGRVPRRILRRVAGKVTGRLLGKLFKRGRLPCSRARCIAGGGRRDEAMGMLYQRAAGGIC